MSTICATLFGFFKKENGAVILWNDLWNLQVVDAIKADRAQASLLRRGSQSITQSQKRSKKAIEGESNDMSGRAWTPASAMESMSRNWDHTSQSHLPQTLAAAAADGTEVDHPLTSVAPPGQSSALSSRRSSFKSSIMELDPSGRADSPGPTHSNDPLAALSVAPKPGIFLFSLAIFGN